jgi:thiosulfate/3-mercaptopyruvate sulfurtransferase
VRGVAFRDDARMNRSELSPLISAQALRALAGSPHLLVVDCRYELGNVAAGRNAYAAGHIPGAVFASMDDDLAAPRGPGLGRHPLPSPATFAAALGRWGFTPASHVVVYDQANGAFAARLWWLLRARGHAAVQLLDGGVAAWLAAGLPTDAVVPQPLATTVAERGFDGVLSSTEVARGLAARSITLVDARAADRFAGRNETVDPVAGHVPGAVNMPFSGNLAPNLQFRSAAELQQRWAPLLEQPALPPVVAMCGSGITACHNLLALELAGHHGARLYAGSFSEWITDPARPVATEESGQ